jgi:hypothetical protein
MFNRTCFGRWTSLPAAALLLAGTATADYLPREYYGAKYEPVDQIIHGAGQDASQSPIWEEAFDRYTEFVGANRRPVTFQDYSTWRTPQSWYDGLKTRLDAYEAQGHYTIPQIGLSLPVGVEAYKNSPVTDAQIQAMADGFKSLDRPVFIRIGYEVNGTWSTYYQNPELYKNDFRRIVTKFREEEVQFASLWNVYPAYSSWWGSWDFMKTMYPGDEYVDWFSFDTFFQGEHGSEHMQEFLDQAHAHGKPVMIGEAAPRNLNTGDAAAWDAWFKSFFELIQNEPGIKGHTYINWDWEAVPGFFDGWGDSRLETADPLVQQNYLDEVSNPIYYHAGEEQPGFIPEPMSGAMFALGLGLLACSRRSRRSTTAA